MGERQIQMRESYQAHLSTFQYFGVLKNKIATSPIQK